MQMHIIVHLVIVIISCFITGIMVKFKTLEKCQEIEDKIFQNRRDAEILVIEMKQYMKNRGLEPTTEELEKEFGQYLEQKREERIIRAYEKEKTGIN